LEAASELRSFLTRARSSHPVKSRFSRLRSRIAPGSKPRLLRNLNGAGNALTARAAFPSSTGSFSGFAFSSTGRIFQLCLQLPSIPLRGALTEGVQGTSEQELPTSAGGAPPHNQRIEPTARRRHVVRLRERHAGARSGHPPALLLRRRASGRCSRLIRALYGLCGGRSSTRGSFPGFGDTKSPFTIRVAGSTCRF
jgi:hypothetical protein